MTVILYYHKYGRIVNQETSTFYYVQLPAKCQYHIPVSNINDISISSMFHSLLWALQDSVFPETEKERERRGIRVHSPPARILRNMNRLTFSIDI